ncbi:putative uncharacterized protein C10orf113 homolog [Octodon degus]|uniref:Uncharacterized protein n=1 Tax=Octodon degus TaxID=10160 RepID=A0A6P6DL60_OCTDE|nr:putative uncharacterized protein C10orf113 homolog [Octodon degus]
MSQCDADVNHLDSVGRCKAALLPGHWAGRWQLTKGPRPPRELTGVTRRPQSRPRLARWLQRQPQSLKAGNWSLSILAVPGTGPEGWAKSLGLSLGPEGIPRGRPGFQFQAVKFSTSKEELKMTSWSV